MTESEIPAAEKIDALHEPIKPSSNRKLRLRMRGDAARQPASSRLPANPLAFDAHAPEAAQTKPAGGGILRRSFLLVVALPTVLAGLYYGILASGVYVAEAKITVRQAAETSGASALASATSSILGKIGLSKTDDTAQNTMMVLDYIKSQAAIVDIGGKAALAGIYSRPSVDWFSRLNPDGSMEDMHDYWRKRVTASVDTSSNILTMRVRAYSPEESLQLAQRIIQSSEGLINRISQRSREDALRRADEEVQRSSDELARVRTQKLTFQQDSGSIDPVESAKQILQLKSMLVLQKIELESKLSASQKSGTSGRPGEKYMENQLGSINQQIARLDDLLFSKTDQKSVSSQLKSYELLKLREEFASESYMLARASYEDARQKLERQQLYLVTIVPPMLPEIALYPRVFTDTLLIGLGCAILWAITALIVASVKDSTGR